MSKILATCAALAVTAMIALPGTAGAAERKADGMRNADQIEVSAQRRWRGHRYGYAPRYRYRSYGPRYGYYGYGGYPAYRPYYYSRPAPFPFLFPFF